MDDQNLQITEQQTSFFSFIHSNKKYDFITSCQITTYQAAQIFLCKIYPLNEVGEIIRIKSHSLKIELNRMMIQQNFEISLSGFKFKLHPIKGVFSLEYSFINKFERNHHQKQNQKILQYLRQKILLQLKRSKALMNFYIRIVGLIQTGSCLARKQIHMNKMLKFTYNSQFYAWVSPNQQKLLELKKKKGELQNYRKILHKNQVWSDYQSEDGQDNYQQSETNSSLDIKVQQQQQHNKTTQSEFYKHFKSQYDKIIPSPLNQSASFDQQMTSEPMKDIAIKFYLSKKQDLQIYRRYLCKHLQCQNLQLSKKQLKPKEKVLNIFNWSFFNQQLNIKQQSSQESNLVSFLESNQCTISKVTKWIVIRNIIAIVYGDFVKNDVKQKSYYMDLRAYRLEKLRSLSVQKKQKDIFGISKIPQKQKLSKKQLQTQDLSEKIEEFFNQQKRLQKNIASILLNLVCFVSLPGAKFLNRINKNYQAKNIKYGSIDHYKIRRNQITIEQQFDKFKNGNLQMEGIFMYLYHKLLKLKQAPLGDWIVIMSEYFKQTIQKNKLLS